jgi:hypothetical protein
MEHTQLSRTYRKDSMPRWMRQRRRGDEAFRCRHCKAMVGPVPSGGRHRNHCPYCLYSRHVDGRVPGDRASDCGGTMAPIGTFTRTGGEQVVVHQCLSCGFVRYNRIAADDDEALAQTLPAIAARRPTVGTRQLIA